MKSAKYVILYTLLLLLFSAVHADDIRYRVRFEGIDNRDILDTLKTVSELIILEESPPSSTTALRRRAEADIPNLLKGLHSFGYYNAKVDFEIDTNQDPALITIGIDLGEIYPLVWFEIVPVDAETEDSFPYETLTLDRLDVELGEPALPRTILEAEGKILYIMTKEGYPLASIVKREVEADQRTKTISVKVYVTSGPMVYFGETTIEGLTEVDEIVVRKKISWCVGEQYHPKLIESTLNAIESCGLFSSVTIDLPDQVSDDNLLPMVIRVIEAKHRTIGGGISYNTQIGPGVIGTWQNRNLRGLGEKLSFHADIAQKYQTGRLLYEQLDFIVPKQNFLWIAEATAEQTRGFDDTSFAVSGLIDRELSKRFKISYGGTFKEIHTTKSDNNGQFLLLKAPMTVRWSTANSLLDPTHGKTVIFKIAPTAELYKSDTYYCVNTVTGLIYQSFDEDDRFILAGKVILGSIWGTTDEKIPPPERFYIGSESTLRGYNYLTVSPLEHNKPIGGRSMVVLAAEGRYRINEQFGAVAFYEVGNVYKSPVPQFSDLLQSVGTGLRYHTAVGPLRFDVAFPLNRRRGIDRAFQVYFSIGQSF